MCIGTPLQVRRIDADGMFADCGDGAQHERLDLRLVGPLPPGTWVLAFHGAARRVLAPDEAQQMRAALQALDRVLQGDAEGIDALFADLVARTPQLPAHLQPAPAATSAAAPATEAPPPRR
mgnify:CR=1 FL=1